MDFQQLVEYMNVSAEVLAEALKSCDLANRNSFSDEDVSKLEGFIKSGRQLEAGAVPTDEQCEPKPVGQQLVDQGIDIGTRMLLESKAIEGGMALASLEGDAHKLAKSLADKRFEVVESIPGLTDYYFKKRFLDTPDATVFHREYDICVEDIDRSWQDDPDGVQKRFAARMTAAQGKAIAGV